MIGQLESQHKEFHRFIIHHRTEQNRSRKGGGGGREQWQEDKNKFNQWKKLRCRPLGLRCLRSGLEMCTFSS